LAYVASSTLDSPNVAARKDKMVRTKTRRRKKEKRIVSIYVASKTGYVSILTTTNASPCVMVGSQVFMQNAIR
jgi:ssDNA-binding replication factor A large subunit